MTLDQPRAIIRRTLCDQGAPHVHCHTNPCIANMLDVEYRGNSRASAQRLHARGPHKESDTKSTIDRSRSQRLTGAGSASLLLIMRCWPCCSGSAPDACTRLLQAWCLTTVVSLGVQGPLARSALRPSTCARMSWRRVLLVMPKSTGGPRTHT